MNLTEKILDLKNQGLSQREIAEKIGMSRGGVRHHLAKNTEQETALVFNDLHYRFQDDKAIELTLKAGDDLEPDYIFLNGDLIDNWEISKFHKSSKLRSKASLSKELKDARKFLTDLRHRFPASTIFYIGGNHEYRWDVYIESNAKELIGLRGLSLEEQLDLDKLDIKWVYRGLKESSWLWGKLLIGHFDRVSKHSSMTAKLLVEDKGISLLQAHCHRGGMFYKRVYDRILLGVENFCLCDLDPPYIDRPNWQQGFSVVYKDKNSDLFSVSPHPIIKVGSRYRVMFEGNILEV